MKRIIWESNPEFTQEMLDALRADLVEMEVENAANMTDDEVESYYLEYMNPDYLADERVNLNRELPGQVLVIADLGLWNGRRQGYRILGDNLNSVLISHVNGQSELSVYGDGYNIRAEEAHHDGTNKYLFRALIPGKNPQPLLDAIYCGKTITKALLNRYTRSVYPYAAAVYGWPCRSRVKA